MPRFLLSCTAAAVAASSSMAPAPRPPATAPPTPQRLDAISEGLMGFVLGADARPSTKCVDTAHFAAEDLHQAISCLETRELEGIVEGVILVGETLKTAVPALENDCQVAKERAAALDSALEFLESHMDHPAGIAAAVERNVERNKVAIAVAAAQLAAGGNRAREGGALLFRVFVDGAVQAGDESSDAPEVFT